MQTNWKQFRWILQNLVMLFNLILSGRVTRTSKKTKKEWAIKVQEVEKKIPNVGDFLWKDADLDRSHLVKKSDYSKKSNRGWE